MTKNHRLAFNALKKIGAPVYERSDIENFQISAEGIRGDYDRDTLWADFYEGYRIDGWDFGINPKITTILSRYNLHAEWINAGEIGVYE
jgi:hypothetical protein